MFKRKGSPGVRTKESMENMRERTGQKLERTEKKREKTLEKMERAQKKKGRT